MWSHWIIENVITQKLSDILPLDPGKRKLCVSFPENKYAFKLVKQKISNEKRYFYTDYFYTTFKVDIFMLHKVPHKNNI